MRTLVILGLLAVAAFVIWGNPSVRSSLGLPERPASEVGTSGTVEKARERGAALGEKAAVAGAKIKDAAQDAAITTKIKAKMALDETVKARAIDVSTDGSTVTVSGTVHSQAERNRALALARETAGVTTVVDHLALAANR